MNNFFFLRRGERKQSAWGRFLHVFRVNGLLFLVLSHLYTPPPLPSALVTVLLKPRLM